MTGTLMSVNAVDARASKEISLHFGASSGLWRVKFVPAFLPGRSLDAMSTSSRPSKALGLLVGV